MEIFEPIRQLLGDKEYIAGDNLTYADFTLFEFIEFCNHLTFGDLYFKHSEIVKYVKKMRNIE